MKVKKGNAGYLSAKRSKYGVQALIWAAAAVILLVLARLIMKQWLSPLSLIAVLPCIPLALALVRLIPYLPYGGIKPELAQEIREKSALLTCAFDMVLKDDGRKLSLDALVICDQKLFGYAPDPKTNPEEAAACIRRTLSEHGYPDATVKIFSEYVPFLSRAEGLNNMMEVSHSNDKKLEHRLRRLILHTSL